MKKALLYFLTALLGSAVGGANAATEQLSVTAYNVVTKLGEKVALPPAWQFLRPGDALHRVAAETHEPTARLACRVGERPGHDDGLVEGGQEDADHDRAQDAHADGVGELDRWSVHRSHRCLHCLSGHLISFRCWCPDRSRVLGQFRS